MDPYQDARIMALLQRSNPTIIMPFPICQKGPSDGIRPGRRAAVARAGHDRIRGFADQPALRGPNRLIGTGPADTIPNP